MLPFGVTIPPTVPQRSEIPEGLMNYPVYLKSPCMSFILSEMNSVHALPFYSFRIYI